MVDLFALQMEEILKVEVLSAVVLTVGLLVAVVFKKKELKSDFARERLEKNINLFRASLFIFFVPLILFIATEVLKLLAQGMEDPYFELRKEGIEVMLFAFLNLGLLLTYLLLFKLKGDSDGRP